MRSFASLRPTTSAVVFLCSMLLALASAGCGDDDAPADAGTDSGALDAGRDGGGTGTDAGAPDAGPMCMPACTGVGERCCPAGLAAECVTETESGECPMPDLTVLPDRAAATARVEWQYFEPGHCAIVEGCVAGEGWRRLLRFDTVTPNIGTGDMHLGVPTDMNPSFVYSMCHMHYHFQGYANYQLLDDAGTEVGSGHKQAFCLLDSEQYITDDPTVRRSEHYTCDNQGIQRGWADNYDASLDCQWVDVTDVDPGDYTLRLSINEMRTLPELDYDNNVAELTVTVPPDMPDPNPTTPCTGSETGAWRNCGYTREAGTRTCTPGEDLYAACGAACGLGTCVDDPILRICEGDGPCGARDALATDDDSCGDYCPRARFTCPASGIVTVLTGDFNPSVSYTCDVAIAPAM